MKTLALEVPDQLAKEMEGLVEAGWFASQAELARLALARVKPRWIEITDLDARSAEIAADWLQAGLLDRGEAQALALAAQVKADWLLTDDAAARVVASQQGLEVHGSLGVILWAAATGHPLRDCFRR
jgi:predicted nucleic acid-binding protein